MEDLFLFLFNFLNENILLFSILIIISLNLFLPASLVIIFFVGMFGFYKGSLISLTVLISSSIIPHIFLNKYNLNIQNFLSNYDLERYLINTKKMSLRSSVLIRLTSIPYLFQNIICSIIEPSIYKYLLINLLSLIPWIIAFGLFSESIRSLRIEMFIFSIFVIGFFAYISNKKSESLNE